MKLKNFVKDFMIAGLLVAATATVAMAAPHESQVCRLIGELQGVFRILRTLAFVGAAFMLAGWAWGYIAGGEAKMEDLKKKGIALLVGFTLLFAVGAVLTFVMSGQVTGCVLTGW